MFERSFKKCPKKMNMKRIVAGVASLGTAVAGLLTAGFANGANYIDISSASSTEILTIASGIFSDLWVLVALAIGLPLGFYIIRRIIGMIRK